MVTPSWQYPNGGTMPVARRMQLLGWASRNEAVIIEDDCDSELRYEGHPQPSLQGLDETGPRPLRRHVQQGALPGPPRRVRGGARRRTSSRSWRATRPAYRGPGALEQRALALFLAEGHFERHLARLRAHFAERQAALLAALAAELGTVVSARPAAAGGPTSSCGSRTWR